MTLCMVTGNVIATVKHPALVGKTLLRCCPIDPATGKLFGTEMIAVDRVQAGPGDRVLVCDEGNAARLVLDDKNAPLRTVVVAVVDMVGM